METNQYTNYAFISYKREDEKWAKWLQKKLESYKLPAIVRDERSELPKYIRPIFRDGTDLSGGVLADQLHQELLRSKYLIVICSPNATKSEWVNKEAQTFINEGRLEQIIPFIIGGTPHAKDPADECFPKALREIPAEKELLGINVQEVGKNMAFVRLVATMLNVRFDTLWQRHRRNLIRRRIAFGCAAAVLVLLGIFVWDYNRATYEYYADWVDCYGVPEGVIPLNSNQVVHRYRSYQFEYRRIPFGEPGAYSWRIAKVRYVNSALRPQDIDDTERKDRYPIQEIEFNKQTGAVARINYCNKQGLVMVRHALYERDGQTACIADLRNALEQRDNAYVNSELTSLTKGEMDLGNRKSKIVRFVYERDSAGHIVKQTYHANNDDQLERSAIGDADRIFGRQFILDSFGRRTKVIYLGFNGEPACTRQGVAGCTYKYDTWSNIKECTYIDINGHPIPCEEQWTKCITRFDHYGNPIEAVYYGDNGKPCLNTSYGIAKLTNVIDKRGNIVEIAFFGIDNKPCYSLWGISLFKIKHDKKGRPIEVLGCDTKGHPCVSREGYFRSTSKYDKRDNVVEIRYWDTDRNPCINKNSMAACIQYKYDNKSNCIETTFFDSAEKPCIGRGGFSKISYQFDESGNCIQSEAFDTNGEPCLAFDGVSKVTYKYDHRGNLIEKQFFGPKGMACRSREGYAISRAQYDDNGNLKQVEFFGTDGKRDENNYGISRATIIRDIKGRQIETSYYNKDDQPCLSFEGIARWTAEYDIHGNRICCEAFGIDGKRCLNNLGYSIIHNVYDTQGRLTETAYYNIHEKPCVNKEGVARVTMCYDRHGNCIEKQVFDTLDAPCMCIYGYSTLKLKYDEANHPIENIYLNKKGEPCNSNEGIASWTEEFDEKGNSIRRTGYGIDRKPCLNNDGFAVMAASYDERSQRTAVWFYGTDGKPCEINQGYARREFSYDKRGNNIAIDNLDTEGRPCLSTNDKSAGERREWDQQGRLVKRIWLGLNGKPGFNIENIAIRTYKYDAYGHVIEQACYGPTGSPCASRYGDHRIINKYDHRGVCIEQCFYGIQNEPIEANGYHRYKAILDADGRILERLYYNASDQLIADRLQTVIVMSVSGQASKYQIPKGSIILRLNNWSIGDPFDRLESEIQRSACGQKDFSLLTPTKEVVHFHVEQGLAGLDFSSYFIEKSEAKRWTDQD